MSSSGVPPEIVDSIARIDAAVRGWPEGLFADWQRVRGYCRARHRESQRVLPAVSLVAQEISMAQTHAANAMKAMEGVFGARGSEQTDSSDEVTANHRLPLEERR